MMKDKKMTAQNFLKVAALVTLFAGPSYGSSLSGTYQVLKADCDSTATISVGDTNVVVRATSSGIKVGEIFYTGDGGPGSKPYLEAAFDFSVGTVRQNCMGDCYTLHEGAYSANGSEFKDVNRTANTDNATPVYAGETDFKLTGDTLEIDNSDDGQFTPAPVTTCLLKKIK